MTNQQGNDPEQIDPTRASPVSRLPGASEEPQSIGRYRIVRVLGEGGFGCVYLAHDDELDRPVAIKVPHPQRVSKEEDIQAYLNEARVLASLDHPNIVPVHDVGRTDDGLCFVVSKFVEGSDLADTIKRSRPGFADAAEIIAAVTDALQHAHERGLFHRDVKPANILMDNSGKPFLADFGLALKDEDFGRGARALGTPAYMSPEQARGEGHRVDGRSDVFSLGVVLYELLTGKRPFRADSRLELLEQITSVDARPPRQMDGSIPKELDRICVKALSKRATDRYGSARDLGDDLRHFLDSLTDADRSALSIQVPTPPSTQATPPTTTPAPLTPPLLTPDSDQKPIKIIPKGLRSFDSHDADYFCELLPGPRDRDGLPDSIRFWKTRIEETDTDHTFSVGLIYGPSGCGKSSFLKAGLLPTLSERVIPIYVEATSDDTEGRLLKGLRKQFPVSGQGLVQTLTALRRGQGLAPGTKVLIVLDQFEQWLHARRHEENTELLQTLRQCDGGNVQCIVTVRDDFWLAVSRFMRDLENDLVPDNNIALVDLFDQRHAKKVLTAFGRSFGALPESALTADQKKFVEQAISGLAEDGKVVCVRLSLFAEMIKGKPWISRTLKEVGGTEGVGMTFLEETFSSPAANPKHRYHQRAARAVLQRLLPAGGADIKGHMKSEAELREVSGYAHRARDFSDLLHLLDTELRLITPTDPEGAESDSIPPPSSATDVHVPDASSELPADQMQSAPKHYQLTHDYLVPSLRDWLTRKQRETMRGRAQLLLEERSNEWSRNRLNRFLPTPLEILRIALLTRKSSWTSTHLGTMRRGAVVHIQRLTMIACAILAVAVLLHFLFFRNFNLERFKNPQIDPTSRIAALKSLPVTERETLEQILTTLENDTNESFVADSLSYITAEYKRESNRSPNGSDALRARLDAFVLKPYVARPIRRAAFVAFAEIATPNDAVTLLEQIASPEIPPILQIAAFEYIEANLKLYRSSHGDAQERMTKLLERAVHESPPTAAKTAFRVYSQIAPSDQTFESVVEICESPRNTEDDRELVDAALTFVRDSLKLDSLPQNESHSIVSRMIRVLLDNTNADLTHQCVQQLDASPIPDLVDWLMALSNDHGEPTRDNLFPYLHATTDRARIEAIGRHLEDRLTKCVTLQPLAINCEPSTMHFVMQGLADVNELVAGKTFAEGRRTVAHLLQRHQDLEDPLLLRTIIPVFADLYEKNGDGEIDTASCLQSIRSILQERGTTGEFERFVQARAAHAAGVLGDVAAFSSLREIACDRTLSSAFRSGATRGLAALRSAITRSLDMKLIDDYYATIKALVDPEDDDEIVIKATETFAQMVRANDIGVLVAVLANKRVGPYAVVPLQELILRDPQRTDEIVMEIFTSRRDSAEFLSDARQAVGVFFRIETYGSNKLTDDDKQRIHQRSRQSLEKIARDPHVEATIRTDAAKFLSNL